MHRGAWRLNNWNVRFTPNSGHRLSALRYPLSVHLLDHFIGRYQKGLWDSKAEWQLGRFLTLQNPIDITGRALVLLLLS
jgi:hypothetical protein